ncbi:MAG: Transposase IS200 like protein [Candidatus Omnitrophica bacterium ADurb.Bin314]|jgi:putative transposase|nr:MAG: Transposase IS200 like protein [Candidatus Omnitrophica bacterium ADurb.Bin314]
MQVRKDPLATGEYYHVYTKSIAGFVIFNHKDEFDRMKSLLEFHQVSDPAMKFSWLKRLGKDMTPRMTERREKERLVHIIAYCLMPTHIHLFLRQSATNGISVFMGRLLNGYARYFNLRHKRKGPLWEGRFKNVRVKTNEQALHLSRYIHLNPASAGLVNKPGEWEHSSYQEYLSRSSQEPGLCAFQGVFDFTSAEYQNFVEKHRDAQRETAILKGLMME